MATREDFFVHKHDPKLEYIVGLPDFWTGAELKAHCEERAAYHATRAEEKEQKLVELKKLMEEIKGHASPTKLSAMNKGGYNLNTAEPVDDLEKDITVHKNGEQLMLHYAKRFKLDSEYVLSTNNLYDLQILKR